MVAETKLARFNMFFPRKTWDRLTRHLIDRKEKRVLRGAYKGFIVKAVEEKLRRESA